MRDPKIFYFCYSHNRPTGGQKDTYRHVDLLNAAGYEAYVLHLEPDFRLTWFSNDTKAIGPEDFRAIYNSGLDYIVLPEDLGLKIHSFPGRKVIFNKGIFLGFKAFGIEKPALYPYQHADVRAALTVSDHNAEHLKFAYPDLEVINVWFEIDPHIFAYTPLNQKEPRIACIPKAPGALSTLFHILNSRASQNLNRLNGFEWTFIQDMSERQVANVLQRSLVFVFLSVEEGLPRTPLEAMSCGCLVAGYKEGPLRECLPPGFQFETGDVMSIAKYIEAIAESFPNQMGQWESLASAGKEQALLHSSEKQKATVLAAWELILSKR